MDGEKIKMEKFSEDNFHSIMTKWSILSKRLLKPAFVFKRNDERITEAEGIKVYGDDTDFFLLSVQDCFNIYQASQEVMSMAYLLESHFFEQFKHNSRVRRICPNQDCHTIYAYFYEDFLYCPKCGMQLITTRDDRPKEVDESEKIE